MVEIDIKEQDARLKAELAQLQGQIDGLGIRLKSEADNLKTIAGEIKTLVS